jgi:holo-[acyl-carrier protein] synthase
MIVGLGHDVFEVSRMEDELRREETSLKGALFTAAEVDYCERKRYPARHFAARFAAKEALFKALGADPAIGQSWCEVEIRNEASGMPHVVLHGGIKELAQQRHVDAVLLSMSHTAGLAAATVVLESREARVTNEER